MPDARVGDRSIGRHRGRHRAPVPPLWQRIERPGAGALAALGVAVLVTAGGSRAQGDLTAGATADQTAGQGAASVLAAAVLERSTGEDRISRGAARSALGVPTAAGDASAPAITAPAPVPTPAEPMLVSMSEVPEPAAPTPSATPKPTPTTPAPPPAAPAPPGGVGPVNPAYAAAAARIGLRGNAILVYSAVRTQFGVTNIGGYRPGDMDHGTGHAVDVMVGSNRALGDAVAAYALANRGAFKVKYIIWKQRIWLPELGYWRAMSDRGSATANHYDHVHISVY